MIAWNLNNYVGNTYLQTDEKANNTSKRLQSHCVSYNFYFGLGLAVIDICSFNLRIVYVTVMPEGEKVGGGSSNGWG